MKTSRLLSLILCTLLMLSWQVETAYAQTVVNYNYVVKKAQKDINGNNITEGAPGFYRYYLNYADAVKDYNKILGILKQDSYIALFDKEIRGDFALQGTPNGLFSFNGVNGMGVIFGLEETKELILIKHDDGIWQNHKIGKTSRDNTFEYKCRKIAANQYEYEVLVRGEVQLDALNVTGKYKRKAKEAPTCGIVNKTCQQQDSHNFAEIAQDLELNKTDFYESPLEKPFDASESLDFNFKHGTAEIIEDAAYNASMQKLREVISYIEENGGMIFSAELCAYASPDGNDRINRELADKRAKAAKEKISVGSLARIAIKTTAIVDTWDHTAEMLEDAGHPTEAQIIRDALERHNKNSQAAYQDIRKYPTYADVIKPTLQKQCRIDFSTRYLGMKLLTPKEAVAAYKENKNGIFSNGDYYNIYAELKDSAEIDELTEIVYNRIIKKGERYDSPFATYVMNKMALLSIKCGTPDSTILMPLIDNNINKLNVVKRDLSGIKNSYIQNRPEILLNQAIIYYMMGDINKASEFIHILDINGWNSDELRKLKKIIF